MISLDDMRPAWRRPAGAQQRRLPLRHKRLAKIIALAKNLDDPIQHHRLHHSAMAAYLKKLFRHNPLVAQKPLIRVHVMWFLADVIGLFSLNAVPFSRNVVQSAPMSSANPVPESRCFWFLRFMFSGRYTWVWPLRNAQSSTPRTVGVGQTGRGAARINRSSVLRDAEVPAEPGAGGTAEGDGGERLAEPQRPACPGGDNARQALCEDPPPAVGIVAEQLAHAQLQPDGPAGPRQVRPLVAAVKTPRRHMAQRAFRSRLLRDQAQSGGGLVWVKVRVKVPGDGVKAGRIR